MELENHYIKVSLSPEPVLDLKSVLCNMSIATPAFFWSPCAGTIFSKPSFPAYVYR